MIQVTHEFELFLADVELRAFRMAEVATSNREEALDIVQDVMLKMASSYAGKAENEWRPLFFRMLQNRITDWYRRNGVRHMESLDKTGENDVSMIEQLADSSQQFQPSHSVERYQAMESLERAMRRLPLRQQQVVMLRLWEGMDVASAARTLAIGEGSVKTHMSRALQTLRQYLGEHWP